MSDFGTMVTRIVNETHRTTAENSYIKDAIVSAIEHYKYTRFWFNEDWVEFKTVASQDRYVDGDFTEDDGSTNFPWEDILTIYYLEYNRSTTWRYPLRRITPKHIDDIKSQTTYESYPVAYAIMREGIQVYPIPVAANDVVEGLCLRDINSITNGSADGATNAWMVEAEELIRNRAKRDFYDSYLHNYQQAQLSAQYELEALSKLLRYNNEKLETGFGILPSY